MWDGKSFSEIAWKHIWWPVTWNITFFADVVYGFFQLSMLDDPPIGGRWKSFSWVFKRELILFFQIKFWKDFYSTLSLNPVVLFLADIHMHEARSVLPWQIFYLREYNLVWIVKRTLLWKLLIKLLHSLPKIILQRGGRLNVLKSSFMTLSINKKSQISHY